MVKNIHEIRDPIHTFIRLDSEERKVIDSFPLQRLRHIHQLAFTFYIYPGATHTRFEHSLGVMELAGRVFDVVTNSSNLQDKVRNLIPNQPELDYWRRVLRMAAVCHDTGHLPFSHAAEEEILKGKDHEDITINIIKSDIMGKIWKNMTPPLREDDIVKLAVGPRKLKSIRFSNWEAILSEIITSDVFGVDRMDYLLRDAYHAGVVYGTFDHFHLIDNIRILPREDIGSDEPALGIDRGGLHSAEALLLARYFMYSQVYLHPIRRIYDIHLKDFLLALYPMGFPIEVSDFIKISDNEIFSEIFKSSQSEADIKQKLASRIAERKHFKKLYEYNPIDEKITRDPTGVIYKACCGKFGVENFKLDPYEKKSGKQDFPLLNKDGRIISSLAISQLLNIIPDIKKNYVFVSRGLESEAVKWLNNERQSILERGGVRNE